MYDSFSLSVSGSISLFSQEQKCYCLRKTIFTTLGHAITIHNSNRSTLEYIKDDFDCTRKNGKLNTVPINQGAMYTIL